VHASNLLPGPCAPTSSALSLPCFWLLQGRELEEKGIRETLALGAG
jgi:hypothetical protein